ncbi:MAG: type II secretion system protein GspG [Candidatus Entotheonellia bacterium]
MRKAVPLDPWSNPYVYVSPAEQSRSGFDLLSYGEDGTPGGQGDAADITSWQYPPTSVADNWRVNDVLEFPRFRGQLAAWDSSSL